MKASEIAKNVDKMIEAIDAPLIALGMIALVASATLLFFEVITRYFFLETFPVVEDLSVNLLVWAVFLMGGPVFKRKGHIGMEFVSAKLTGHAKALQQLLLHLFLLFVCILLIWKGSEVVQLIYRLGETTPSGELSTWYLVLPAPLGGALFGFYSLAGIVKIFCVFADPTLSDLFLRPHSEE